MPHKNRVTPFGDIVATPHRGILLGNRGCLTNARGDLARPWRSKAWISCLLEWKGHWRPVMQPGVWTELFFLDEATALAAGHRPCFACRREAAERFRTALSDTLGRRLSAPEIDGRLHAERLKGICKRTFPARLGDLPSGVMAARKGEAWLLDGDVLRRWSLEGYDAAVTVDAGEMVEVLTPPLIVEALRAGYEPLPRPAVRSAS